MNGCPPESPTPFRLLDLPAELRLRIYEHALTAPDNIIRIYYSYQKNRINPGLILPLLRTCRQVHSEARGILYDNTVFVHADLHRIDYPVIGASQLPAPALANIRRLFVVLDVSDSFTFSYDDVDFGPFQQLVGLRHLRLAAVHKPRVLRPTEIWTYLLSYVLERVPARCALAYGAASDEERRFVARYCNPDPRSPVAEMPCEALMRAVGYSQAEQGCKSGSSFDYRAYPTDVRGALLDVRTW